MASFKKSRLNQTKPLVNKLKEIAKKHEATPAQIALNWLINFHGEQVFAIPGASTTKQAESNAAAMKINLLKEEMDLLDEISEQIK